MKKMIAVILCALLCSQTCYMAVVAGSPILKEEDVVEEGTTEIELSAETAILMEAETGRVLFEREADKALPPASVTKVMTLLLIFDALEDGKITLD